jgi:hypothetical protein
MRLACLGLVLFIPAAVGAAPPVSYSRDVRPILAENCLTCHGQDLNRRKADLRLDTQEGQRAGGVIVPTKPDESELVRRILSADPKKVMPPSKVEPQANGCSEGNSSPLDCRGRQIRGALGL